ncbi:hypothetical protein RJT34_10446 [Clitoria ternatea]|uniref:Uncharacterized protein n=1 Tax=Clitoria ternatea TaxID=43366 RepID=A0AAN9K8M1_CLITE
MKTRHHPLEREFKAEEPKILASKIRSIVIKPISFSFPFPTRCKNKKQTLHLFNTEFALLGFHTKCV